jgi:hypothetical protein
MDTRDGSGSRPLLTFGAVDRLRVEVGYRARPDGAAYRQYLLDLPVREEGLGEGALAEGRILAALEPVLLAGLGAPRHYSLHQHRWHTTWGVSPNALEIGLLVTAGARTGALSEAMDEGATTAFRDLLELTGQEGAAPASRDEAILRARQSTAAAFLVDRDSLWLGTEEHDQKQGSWAVGLRTPHGEEYDVVVGFVDGHAGSVRVRHVRPIEVSDSVGSE